MARRRRARSTLIDAPPSRAFALVDGHARLASHERVVADDVWRGGCQVELDSGQGQVVGSHIWLTGTVFGLRLFLDEVVTRRDPPTMKAWPRWARRDCSYDLPSGRVTRWLGRLLSRLYARWCVTRMLRDVATHDWRQDERPDIQERSSRGGSLVSSLKERPRGPVRTEISPALLRRLLVVTS